MSLKNPHTQEMVNLRRKGWTLAKIAAKFKVSRQRVHQILQAEAKKEVQA